MYMYNVYIVSDHNFRLTRKVYNAVVAITRDFSDWFRSAFAFYNKIKFLKKCLIYRRLKLQWFKS